MGGRSRALVGTRAGYGPCRVCGHARLRHLDRGVGACSSSVYVTTTTMEGGQRTVPRRCSCPKYSPREALL